MNCMPDQPTTVTKTAAAWNNSCGGCVGSTNQTPKKHNYLQTGQKQPSQRLIHPQLRSSWPFIPGATVARCEPQPAAAFESISAAGAECLPSMSSPFGVCCLVVGACSTHVVSGCARGYLNPEHRWMERDAWLHTLMETLLELLR